MHFKAPALSSRQDLSRPNQCIFDASHKGPYIKDVRREGGRGVGLKADIVREVAWIYS